MRTFVRLKISEYISESPVENWTRKIDDKWDAATYWLRTSGCRLDLDYLHHASFRPDCKGIRMCEGRGKRMTKWLFIKWVMKKVEIAILIWLLVKMFVIFVKMFVIIGTSYTIMTLMNSKVHPIQTPFETLSNLVYLNVHQIPQRLINLTF